jgi:hypothetical protein
MHENLSDVVRIYDTTRVIIANRYIECGWELHKTYITREDSFDPEVYRQRMHYCLIWRKPKGAVVEPDLSDLTGGIQIL